MNEDYVKHFRESLAKKYASPDVKSMSFRDVLDDSSSQEEVRRREREKLERETNDLCAYDASRARIEHRPGTPNRLLYDY